MIEKILKKPRRTFQNGTVSAVNAYDNKVRVQVGNEGLVWVKTSLSLVEGDTVIMASTAGVSRFIVQATDKSLPAVNTLLLV